MKKALLLFLAIAIPAFSQVIDPKTQINWPRVSGSGSPLSAGFTCSATNFGQPYTDKTGPHYWVCTNQGGTPTWYQVDGAASGPTIEHEGVDINQSIINLIDSSYTPPSGASKVVWAPNTSTGAWGAYVTNPPALIDMQPQGLPAGQHTLIYPTACTTSDNNVRTVSTVGSATWQGVTVYPNGSIINQYYPSSFPPALGQISCTFTGALEAEAPWVNPANITSLVAFSKVGYSGGSPKTVSCGSGSMTINPYTLTTDYNATAGGTSPDSLTCSAQISDSLSNPWTETLSIGLMGFAVYYTGTAPPTDNSLQVNSPLIIENNALKVDPSFPQWLTGTPANATFTVPPYPGSTVNVTRFVFDYAGTSPGACGSGGGTTPAWATSVSGSWYCYPLSGSGSSLSLTTTGTSGPASYSSGTLNVPQYQGQLSLTTTGTSGPATLSGNTLNIPQYSGGTGGIGGSGTLNYIPKFTPDGVTLGNSHLDDGVTTAGTVTSSEPVAVNDGSGNAGAFKAAIGTDPGGTSGKATYTTDATNGYAMVHEGTGAASRICTAANSSGVTGCGTGGGGSGIPWDSVNNTYFIGDSWDIVTTVNTNTATAVSCDGTNCTVTVPGTYTVGQWVALPGNIGGYAHWNPLCIENSINKITSVVAGTSITFSEAGTITPGRTGCTGAQTGTGGIVQDATYFNPTQTANLPYLTHGGTVTPVFKNLGWPGATVADWDTNFSTYTSGVSGALILFSELGGQDSYCSSGALTALQGHYQSLWTKWHGLSGGSRIIQATLQNPGTATCPYYANLLNEWLKTQICSTTAANGTTGCVDDIVDYATFGITNGANPYWVQQSGPFPNHPTDQGNGLMANANNFALFTKASATTGGTPGLGSNYYNGTQQVQTPASAGRLMEFVDNTQHNGYDINLYTNYASVPTNFVWTAQTSHTSGITYMQGWSKATAGYMFTSYLSSGFGFAQNTSHAPGTCLTPGDTGTAPTSFAVGDCSAQQDASHGIKLAWVQMGASAPTAGTSCTGSEGIWELTQDGNATFCSGTTHNWTTFGTSGVSSLAATSPIVVSGSTGAVTISCPTCSTGSGTNVSINGGSALGTFHVNGNTAQVCADTSGSGTSQTCTTTDSFTPTTNNCWTYTTTTANTSTALTLSVNTLSKSVAVPSATGWTTTLTAGQVPANKPLTMCYDGTNYNVQSTGINAGGSGSYPTPVTVTASGVSVVEFIPGTNACFSGSYKNYDIILTDVVMASGSSVHVGFEFHTSGGYDASNDYYQGRYFVGVKGGDAAGNNANQTAVAWIQPDLSGANSYSTDSNWTGTYRMYNPQGSQALKKLTAHLLTYSSSTSADVITGGAAWNNTSAADGFKLFVNGTGTFSGTITCQPLPQ